MYLLKFTNKWEEHFYFVAHGATHFSAGLGTAIHLIADTTEDVAKARRFATEEDANTAFARSGKPAGWEVVPAS